MVWHTIRLSSYKEEDIFDGLFISFGSALFIGRLVYVILHFDDFGFNIAKFIFINGYPGISLYGALIGGVAAYYLYSATHKIHFMEVSDYFAPALFLGIAIGKLGSFFAGVEVGTKTSILFAVRYAGYDGFRHLSSLYEALLFFAGAYFAFRILFQIRRSVLGRGFGLFFFCWYLTLVTFIVDFIKESEPTILPNSSRPIIYTTILLTITVYFVYYFRSKIFKLLFRGKGRSNSK